MTDSLPPFGAARLKLARAAHHISELEGEIATFMASKPVVLIVEQHPLFADLGSHCWTARIRKPVPSEFATIIGDAAHNLRSALDLMASDLVRLNGQSTKDVYFPVAKDAAGLEGQIRDKNFRRAHPDVVDLLRSLKPYTGGNLALRGLHDLDIMDKHQAIIPALSAARTEPFVIFMNGARNDIPAWESVIPHDGWMAMVMPGMDNVPLGTEIAATFSVVFRKDTPFPTNYVIPTLRSLHEYCASIVEAFATLCKGQAFPVVAPPQSVGQQTLIIGPNTA